LVRARPSSDDEPRRLLGERHTSGFRLRRGVDDLEWRVEEKGHPPFCFTWHFAPVLPLAQCRPFIAERQGRVFEFHSCQSEHGDLQNGLSHHVAICHTALEGKHLMNTALKSPPSVDDQVAKLADKVAALELVCLLSATIFQRTEKLRASASARRLRGANRAAAVSARA
jgi:hypothetical protein